MLTSLMVLIFVCAPSFTTDTFAQEGQEQEQKAREGATSKGNAKDPNINNDKITNSKDSKAQPPASKGGTAKGAPCEVQLDNWTQWIVKIYIDGEYHGTIGGYDESYTYAVPGRVKVYARADFDDGSYLYWGPRDYSCGPNEYVYFKMVQ